MAAASTSAASAPAVNPRLRRTMTSNTVTDSESSAAVSPADSPRPSPSSTSLSSLSSVDVEQTKPSYGRLVDTYGNEFTPPDYTIKDIRDAIPKHCFERSAVTGYYYVLRDIALIVTTFAIWNKYVTPENIPSTPARAALWAVYTVLQGFYGTGIWILAHECGHGAFSESEFINNLTGWVLHSAVLVPFFSWKFSHSAHHKATGHMEREMVFLPRTREAQATRLGRLAHELHELTEETPIYTAAALFFQQIGGWPNYLLSNVTGHTHHDRQREGRGKGKTNGFMGGVNHFDPASPIFDNKHAKWILLSDLGLAITLSVLGYAVKQHGWANVAVWYIIPYLWVNHWLVAITYLQHTDPSLPHYTAEEWTYVRGAAATIDREMGFIGRQLFHGIAETHVLHHYVSTIPFYHADEATEAIKGVMGTHYRSDTKNAFFGFLAAMWRSARMCQWVEPSAEAEGSGKGILFYRNRNGLGTKPAVVKANA